MGGCGEGTASPPSRGETLSPGIVSNRERKRQQKNYTGGNDATEGQLPHDDEESKCLDGEEEFVLYLAPVGKHGAPAQLEGSPGISPLRAKRQ